MNQATTKEMKVIDFLGVRKPAMWISMLLSIAAIVLIAVKGLNFGLDFTGGTLIEISYSKEVPLNDIRDTLGKAGYERITVVNYGSDTEVMVRMPKSDDPHVGNRLLETLQKDTQAELELRRVEFVGPQVGEELREAGGLAMLLALMAVAGYVALRYQYKFAVGAIVSLFHDVIMALGFFALFQWDFDLNTLAAILAIVGYSINDTIVIFDRIRENFRKLRKMPAIDVLNISTTETLDRTLATSGITLAVLLSLFLFGGESLRGFSLALIIGTVVGTYSSVYVASAISLSMNLAREDLMEPVVQKEGASTDGRP
ncbi:MAG: protein translocase subunit SecF [Spongiibacteraceae bacterium]